MSAVGIPSSLPASPGCGVRIQLSRARHFVSAIRFRASASTTTGFSQRKTISRAARDQAVRPRPGPIARTLARSTASASALGSVRGRQISSGRPAAIAGTFSGATATVTSPAPTRRQASPAKRAAPGIPVPLPTINTRPKSPLFAALRRRGSACWMSASTMRSSRGLNVAASGGASSKSSNDTVPAYSGPSPVKSPVFRPTNVTVQSARTVSPRGIPVSLSRPDGTSRAKMGRSDAFIARMTLTRSSLTAPRTPVPSNASTMTSPSLSRSAAKGRREPPLALKSS